MVSAEKWMIAFLLVMNESFRQEIIQMTARSGINKNNFIKKLLAASYKLQTRHQNVYRSKKELIDFFHPADGHDPDIEFLVVEPL
jgi:hypothetical protein